MNTVSKVLIDLAVATAPLLGIFGSRILVLLVGKQKAAVIVADVKTVVMATEQMALSGQISPTSKLGTALSTLKMFHPTANELKLRQLIEQTVKEMNTNLSVQNTLTTYQGPTI